MSTIQIHEVATLKPSDPEGKLWDVTLIEAGMSANGRLYEAKVLKEAAPLFEGSWTYLDHPTEDEERQRPERSILEKAGRISKVQSSDSGLQGEWAVVDLALRERMLEAQSLGISDWAQLSINAVGTGEEVKENKRTFFRVDKIEKVNSVDVVTVAAAGGKVNRLLASNRSNEDMEIEWKRITLEEVKQNLPTVVERIRKEVEAELAESDELKVTKDKVTELEDLALVLETERDEALKRAEEAEGSLRDRDVQLRALDAARIVSEALTASDLPEKAQKYVKVLLNPAMQEFARSEAGEDRLRASVDKAVADVKELLGEARVREPQVHDMGGGPADPVQIPDMSEDDVAESWAFLKGVDKKNIKESSLLL